MNWKWRWKRRWSDMKHRGLNVLMESSLDKNHDGFVRICPNQFWNVWHHHGQKKNVRNEWPIWKDLIVCIFSSHFFVFVCCFLCMMCMYKSLQELFYWRFRHFSTFAQDALAECMHKMQKHNHLNGNVILDGRRANALDNGATMSIIMNLEPRMEQRTQSTNVKICIGSHFSTHTLCAYLVDTLWRPTEQANSIVIWKERWRKLQKKTNQPNDRPTN